jgi:hypothetical protein
MTKQIPLRGKYGEGKFALVDDDDYEYLSQYKWRGDAKGYARYSVYSKPQKKILTVMMHRLILNTPDDLHTDHWNGDRLDNRRSNLRVATMQQNMANQKAHGGTSNFKGVGFRHGLWQAQIGVDQKVLHIGVFDTQRAAAQAYNDAATQYFGEFAKLNDLSLLAPEDDLPVRRQGQPQSHNKVSRYLGVYFDKRRNMFMVCVVHKRKYYYGGRFDDEIEAAKARDELAKKLHGVRAKLNFLDLKGDRVQQSSPTPEQLGLWT